MIKTLITSFFILSLTGCSDPKYLSTINYDFQSGFVIAETRNSMGNIPPYSFFIVKKNNDLRDMTFMVSAISRYSSPEILLNLKVAKFKFNGVELPALNEENIKMVGKVDPTNGRSTFDKVEIKFPYPKDLRWGEKLKPSESENYSSTFEIFIPAQIEKKAENIIFTYVRRDISGDPRFGKVLSF